MLNWRHWLAVCTAIFLSYGCASELGKTAHQQVNERNYTKVLLDEKGNPILRLTAEYIGKAPVGLFKADHDWKANDTDFYNGTWENLSESTVEFVSGKRTYSNAVGRATTQETNEKGEQKKVSASYVIDMKREYPSLSSNGLKPKEKRNFKNVFASFKSEYNEVHQYLTIRYLEKEYTVDFYMVYKR
jgi:hypothetical protein